MGEAEGEEEEEDEDEDEDEELDDHISISFLLSPNRRFCFFSFVYV